MIITSVLAFVRRELVSVAHQPRLLVTMVLGPFLVLLAFGLGYRNERLVLDTVFVAPADSPLSNQVEQSADGFSEFIEYRGMTDDVFEARQMLRDGDVDVVVVLPTDPLEAVLSGERAEVSVIHDKLDPIQQTAIGFAARLAVDQLNAEVLARLVGQGQQGVQPFTGLAGELGAADQRAAELVEVDPAVLVQPFTSSTSTASPTEIDITDYFAPAAFALLVQHIGVSLGALTFVRDRELGLMEAYRVSPLSSTRVLVGKYLGFTLVAALVAVPLFLAIRYVLDVPVLGDPAWIVVVVVLVSLASLGIGLLLSLVAATVSQAVQYAMLVLLASLFLGGVFLDLERLRLPVEIVSWLLPVTYAISLLQDVMLRGQDPALGDVIGLTTLGGVAAVAAAVLLHRGLRTR